MRNRSFYVAVGIFSLVGCGNNSEPSSESSGSGGATTTVATTSTVGGGSTIPGTVATGGTVAAGGTSSGKGGTSSISETSTGGTTAIGSGGKTGIGGTKNTGGTSSTSTQALGGSGTGGSTTSTGTTKTGNAVPSAGCGKARTLKDGNLTITSGGSSRTYHLKTPSNYDNNTPYRVIFMFHWNYGSINAIVNPPDADHNTDLPYYGLGSLAGDSTIFVVPQGLTDTGGAGWANPNNRDVNFTDDMLAAISADLCIDTSRVFTTGFSYGGAISYKLACVRADKFRAALVYDTGPVSGNNTAECTKPIAFFQTHGTDDQTFNYTQTGLPILNTFAKVNGCTATTPPTPPSNGHTCTSLTGCSEGHPVRFCGFGAGENNPHNTSLKGHYPSPKDPGQTVSWVPTEAWEFIKQF